MSPIAECMLALQTKADESISLASISSMTNSIAFRSALHCAHGAFPERDQAMRLIAVRAGWRTILE